MDETELAGALAEFRGGRKRRRAAIDWDSVRGQLARQNVALAETFAGSGPWADAVLARRAEQLAERPAAPDLDRPAVPTLIARGAETRYGLELRHLGHIVPMPRLARVPGAPPAVLGVIAVGGRVMRLFDLDRLCNTGGDGGSVVSGIRGPGGAGDVEVPGYAVVLRTGAGRPAALRVAVVERVADIDPPRFGAPAEAGQFIKTITGDRLAVLDMVGLLKFVTM